MQAKANFFSDNPDIKFHLMKRLDFDALFAGMTQSEKDASSVASPEDLRNMSLTVLETLGEIAGGVIAPNAAQVEKEDLRLIDGEVPLPPALTENLKALLEFGVAALGMSPEYGGIGTPFFLEACANELIMRACPSTRARARV